MALTARDIVSLSRARARLSELADEVRAGAENVITKNGDGQLDLLRSLERGLDDIEAGRVTDARAAVRRFKSR